MHAPTAPLTSFLHGLRTWPQASQEQARRNAMLAATACTQRRIERQQVEDYFTSLTSEPESAHLNAK